MVYPAAFAGPVHCGTEYPSIRRPSSTWQTAYRHFTMATAGREWMHLAVSRFLFFWGTSHDVTGFPKLYSLPRLLISVHRCGGRVKKEAGGGSHWESTDPPAPRWCGECACMLKARGRRTPDGAAVSCIFHLHRFTLTRRLSIASGHDAVIDAEGHSERRVHQRCYSPA